MVNRTLQPQEIEVFYVLPALRRELTNYLKEAGKSQKEVAKLLGVTEPAVSQYMSSKRAAAVDFNEAILAEIKISAGRIGSGLSTTRELQRLLKMVRDERVVCRMHEKLGTAPKGCDVCFEQSDVVNIEGAK